MAAAATAQPRKRHTLRNVFLLVAVALLAFGVYRCSVPHASDAGAQQACRDQVRSQLKDPSSGDFSGEAVTSQGTNNWKVTGTVRSTNSFGGTAVNTYTCSVLWNADDGYSPYVKFDQ